LWYWGQEESAIKCHDGAAGEYDESEGGAHGFQVAEYESGCQDGRKRREWRMVYYNNEIELRNPNPNSECYNEFEV
jgi:hypothetical protein